MARFEDWLEAIHNPQTSAELSYDCEYACRTIGFEHPDELLELVEGDARAASDRLLTFV